jgi:hypothetical protein
MTGRWVACASPLFSAFTGPERPIRAAVRCDEAPGQVDLARRLYAPHLHLSVLRGGFSAARDAGAAGETSQVGLSRTAEPQSLAIVVLQDRQQAGVLLGAGT